MDYKSLLEGEFRTQKEKIANARAIILYGNSIVSCILRISIKELGFDTKCLIFDHGRYLSSDSGLIGSEPAVVILCSSRMTTRKEMAEDASRFFPDADVFDFFAIYYQWITQVIQRKCDYDVLAETLVLCRNEESIPNIDSINTLFCNLRCKECSNGIQFRKEKKRIPVDSQILHLGKMTDKLPICQCNFQGGEVFTDVSFAEFIERHSFNARIGIFTIATNGTILPKDDVFRVIRSIGAMVRISDYGEISRQKQSIIRKCMEFGIPCFTFPMAETWRRFGNYQKRNRPERELRQICESCCFGTHDMMFVDDKLFCCLRTLFASAVGDENEAMIANTLYLDSDFTAEQLKDFVRGKNLWMMCDYCDFPMEEIPPAEQM